MTEPNTTAENQINHKITIKIKESNKIEKIKIKATNIVQLLQRPQELKEEELWTFTHVRYV